MIDRAERIRRILRMGEVPAAICSSPVNVLMVTGYWPIIGNSLALITEEGRTGLLVPEDEEESARACAADEIHTFQAGSLEHLAGVPELARAPLSKLASAIGFRASRLGHDGGDTFEPSTYASMYIYGSTLPPLLSAALPGAELADVSHAFAMARAVLTKEELAKVRKACAVAGQAFQSAVPRIRPGMEECEIASMIQSAIHQSCEGESRIAAFAWCMSGANSARAWAAYQVSGDRRIRPGDFALIHCNSHSGGFWTDITRTYTIGEPSQRQRGMYRAVLEAAQTAIDAVRPGVAAYRIDETARGVMIKSGFGREFRHATGHGVGFSSINHNAHPRIHPMSKDKLEPGMVFNIEPALYIEGECGLRHCTMIAVTETGAEELTPFHSRPSELHLEIESAAP